MSKAHWLALASISGIGGVTARKLLEQFGDIEGVFSASVQDLTAVPRVTNAMAESIASSPIEPRQEEVYALSEEEISLLTWEDDGFPALLRHLPDAPLLLYVRGAIRKEDSHSVAIVGTREASEWAAQCARELAKGLALRGLTVVSGLALGIDTAAHEGALDAEEGRTLAVLGSGVQMIHPRENFELAARIIEHGAVLSEYPPSAPPRGPQLMARDRITSGLSRAVIVVQASSKSGSLDTADRARNQARLLYAVPGSPGTDGLLKTDAVALPAEIASIDFDHLAETIRKHRVKPPAKEKPSQPSLF